ncbi:MarR family winged helix-turn-helix transcriptional regulator [Kineococcus sp. TBRC 1896]|uniref:MarR family winged helix-turn-helix transcriptional regulator n=1 Tax=Kineococcus mangrovi TaxID=1660183 RepID=A0ABV4I5Z0_9ACTN
MDDTARATVDASRALVGVAVRSMAQALEEVTLTQYRTLLLVVTHGPLRSGLLAEHVGVHASSFTRLADRLVQDGWATRQENAANRREVLLAPTESGRRLVEDVMRRREQEVARILAALPAGRRRVVEQGMRAFAGAADEVAGPGDDPGGPVI